MTLLGPCPRRFGTLLLCSLVVLGALAPGTAGGAIGTASAGGTGATGATAPVAATPLQSCTTLTLDPTVTTTISSSGCYVVGGDVTNATADPLIRVAATGVTIDGGGHLLDGTGEGTAIAMDTSVSPADPVVTGFVASDWRDAVVVNATTNATVRDVTVENASGIAVGLGDGTTDSLVSNVAVRGADAGGIEIGRTASSNAVENVLVTDVSGPGVRTDGDDNRVTNVTVEGSRTGLAAVGSRGTYGTDVTVSGSTRGVVIRGDATGATTDTAISDVTARDTETAFRTAIGPTGTRNTNNSFPKFSTAPDTRFDIHGAQSVAITPRSSVPNAPRGTAALGPSIDARALDSTAYLDLTMGYDGGSVAGFDERSIRLWRFDDSGSSFVVGANAVNTSGNAVTANATAFGALAPVGLTDEAILTPRTVESDTTVTHTLKTAYLGMSGNGQTNTVRAVFDDTVAGNLTLDSVNATDLDGSESFTVSNTGVVDGPDGDGLLETVTADVSTTEVGPVDTAVEFSVTADYPAVSSDTTVPIDRRITDADGTQVTGPWANVTVVAPDGTQQVRKEPSIDVSAGTLEFGSVAVNRSATETLTISNDGQAGLSVSGLSLEGTDADRFEVDSDAFFLDAGESRTVRVTFSPVERGVVDAALVVRSDDPGRSRVEVSLDGIGVSSDMSVNASQVGFGAVPVGATATEPVAVRNDGAANLTVEGIEVAGANATAFAVDRARLSVPSTTERVLNVTFTPASTGAKTATLSLVSAESETIDVLLAGNGTASTLSAPDTLVFDPTPVGENRTRLLRLTNGGASPLELTDGTVTGRNETATTAASVFTVDTDALTVPANGSAQVRVTFAPATAGPTNASLSLRGPDGRTNVTLDGTGVGPRPMVSPASVTFGNVSVGTPVTAQLAVENAGGGSLNVTDLSLSGPSAAAFDVGDVSPTLGTGQQRTLNVTFTPGERGRHAATLTVTTSAGVETVALNGSGAATTLSVSPLSLSFGSTTPAEPVTRTVTVTNDGSRSVNVSNLSLRGSASAFTVRTDAPLAVPAGESRDVRVRFRPRTGGAATASLVLASDDAAVPPSAVPLRGSGSVPDVRVEPRSLTFGSVAVGESVTRNLTVVNEGSAPLSVGDVALTSGLEGVVALNRSATGTLTPGERREIPVTFTPAARRTYSGTLQFVTDDPDEPVVPVWVSNSNTTANLSLRTGRNSTNFSANVRNVAPGSEVGFEFGGNASVDRSDTALTGLSVRFRSGADGGNGSTLSASSATLAAPTAVGRSVARARDDRIDFSLEATSSATPIAGTPRFRTPADGTVGLRYIDVTHSFPNSAVENASMTFRVARDRIASLRGTDPEDVVVYRYDDGDWIERPTEIVAERDGWLVLRATADGFSDWTVGAKQASFDVVRADVSVSSVTVGDSVNVNVRIENTGGADGQFLTELLLNQNVVDSREIEIAAGGTAQVTFDRSFRQSGTYRVRVNDVPAGSVRVSSSGPGGTGTGTGTQTSTGSGDAIGTLLVALVVTAAAAVAGRRWH